MCREAKTQIIFVGKIYPKALGCIPGKDTSSTGVCSPGPWAPAAGPNGAGTGAGLGSVKSVRIKVMQQKPYHENHNPPALPIPPDKL